MRFPLAFVSALVMLVVAVAGTHRAVSTFTGGKGHPATLHVAAKPPARTSTGVSSPTSVVIATSTVAARGMHRTGSGRRTHPLATRTPEQPGSASAAGGGVLTPVPAPATPAPPISAPGSGVAQYMNSPAPAPVIPPAAVSPSGIITLANYWVGPPVARPGRTVSIVYVVDNGTGTTVHLVLGASIKPTSAPSWIANAVSDPARDAVAVVAPGTTIHLRYFRLPINLQPGTYDVAWGLRNPLTHQRVILLTARAYLHVIRSA